MKKNLFFLFLIIITGLGFSQESDIFYKIKINYSNHANTFFAEMDQDRMPTMLVPNKDEIKLNSIEENNDYFEIQKNIQISVLEQEFILRHLQS